MCFSSSHLRAGGYRGDVRGRWGTERRVAIVCPDCRGPSQVPLKDYIDPVTSASKDWTQSSAEKETD